MSFDRVASKAFDPFVRGAGCLVLSENFSAVSLPKSAVCETLRNTAAAAAAAVGPFFSAVQRSVLVVCILKQFFGYAAA